MTETCFRRQKKGRVWLSVTAMRQSLAGFSGLVDVDLGFGDDFRSLLGGSDGLSIGLGDRGAFCGPFSRGVGRGDSGFVLAGCGTVGGLHVHLGGVGAFAGLLRV